MARLVPRLRLEWDEDGLCATGPDGARYVLASESVRGEATYWTVYVYEEPGQPVTRVIHREEYAEVESFGCTKAQARATAERDAWYRQNEGDDA
jgi:hypothetical protein